ncbi:MAG: metallophosphoesterase family protein [Candidatus Methanoperedens sp.]|nr:metallophosphoesterase family protein [Candidatus Methanoperedens sp.]
MSTSDRLTEVFESSKEIVFDDSSKFIFFSDCHRGDNSWADDFADNQSLLFHALDHYYKNGFTYIEIGDGDELWENKKFEVIRQQHSDLFWLMSEFHEEKRLYLIWGNHDIERKNKKKVENTLYQYYDEREKKDKLLFKNIEVHEGLVLRHSVTNNKIFLVHGHQGDLLSDSFWWLSRFLVGHIWRHLQLLGVRDPTSPAQNFKKQVEVEKKIIDWVKAEDQMLIAGHTHRPVFPSEGEPPYFNDGSCVHPRCVTGIEIQNNEINVDKVEVQTK